MLSRPAFVASAPLESGALLTAAASASLAVAAGAHLAAFPGHIGEGVPIAGFFIVVGVVQLAAALISRPPRVRAAVVAANLGLLTVWAVSRTVGLPFGPHPGTAEAVGVLDVTAAVAQVVAVATLLMLGRRLQRRAGAAPALALVAVTTAVGLAGVLLLPVSHGAAHDGGTTATRTSVTGGDVHHGGAAEAHDEPHGHP